MSKNKENYQGKTPSIWDCGGVLLFSMLCCFVVFWLFCFGGVGGCEWQERVQNEEWDELEVWVFFLWKLTSF